MGPNVEPTRRWWSVFQPVDDDLLIYWGPGKKNCTDATITTTMTTVAEIQAMEVTFFFFNYTSFVNKFM